MSPDALRELLTVLSEHNVTNYADDKVTLHMVPPVAAPRVAATATQAQDSTLDDSGPTSVEQLRRLALGDE